MRSCKLAYAFDCVCDVAFRCASCDESQFSFQPDVTFNSIAVWSPAIAHSMETLVNLEKTHALPSIIRRSIELPAAKPLHSDAAHRWSG